MNKLLGILCCMLFASHVFGQGTDLIAIHQINPDEVSFQLFENEGESLRKVADPFKIRSIEFAENHPNLNLAGDFDGDGRDEIAVFTDLKYTPNMNPEFTCSVIKIYNSSSDRMDPHNTWFSMPDTTVDFKLVKYALAADFNRDRLTDIALIYNDPSQDEVQVYVLESDGEHFSEPIPYFVIDRNEFNFTALSFASAGDFNGNGEVDIALFYNYFGTAPETRQSIFLLEINGEAFTLLPAAYTGTKQDYDFSEIKYVLAGDYNQDGNSDLAVIREDATGQYVEFPVFEGSADSQLTPELYVSIPSADMEYARIGHTLAGEFAGDAGSDLALFYDDPGSGGQEIHILESESGSFKASVKHFVSSPELLLFEDFSTVIGGSFVHDPPVTVCTWKEDKKGAVSFTFDDGARGAFEHGAAELEAAGLKGTFYIFTDTTTLYDSEIAETSLIREYRDLGHEIGSHTHNHSNLGLLTETGNLDSLTQVLSTSLDMLNERFDQQTFSLSIPYGSFRHETLDHIAQYFHSSRSSQYGFNLSTPYDFFALRSWPILSTTSPAYVNMLVERASNYGYYLPLMYHDITDEPFEEEAQIYMYSRDLFRETIQEISDQDVWVDTHARIYKYIRERNALKIEQVLMDDADAEPGKFSFVLSDKLADSIFDVELTLKIRLPESWDENTISLEVGDSLIQAEVQWDPRGDYVLCNILPVDGLKVQVHEELVSSSDRKDNRVMPGDYNLSAYPNPFRFQTYIQIDGKPGQYMQLILLDIHGRMVREIALQGQSSLAFNADKLSPGLYILMLLEGGVPAARLKLMAQ